MGKQSVKLNLDKPVENSIPFVPNETRKIICYCRAALSRTSTDARVATKVFFFA